MRNAVLIIITVLLGGCVATHTLQTQFNESEAAYVLKQGDNTITGQADGNGDFTFNNIADGNYHIVTYVFWKAGDNQQGGQLLQQARVSGGEVVKVIMNGQ